MRFVNRRWISLATLITFFGSQAYAGSLPTLAVPPIGEAQNQRASDAIADAFRSTRKVTVIDRTVVDRQIQARKKSTSLESEANEEGAKALKNGETAYRKLKIKEAVKWFSKAKRTYRKKLSDDESFQGLRAAQFHLAKAYLTMKDETRAREELREFIRIDPERNTRKLSEKQYSPAIRNLHEKVSDEMAKEPQGDLIVSTVPPKAVVFVDGKAEGASPITIQALPVGEHFIRVSADGLETHFSAKFVVKGENRLEVDLKPLLRVDPYQTFGTVPEGTTIDHRRAAFLDELGLALGADIWVFLSPGNAEVSGQLYDQRSQELSTVARDSTPEGLVQKLVHSIDRDGYVQRKVKPDPKAAVRPAKELPPRLKPNAEGTFSKGATKPKRSRSRSSSGPVWYKNHWVWIGIGGALLLGTASVFMFTNVGQKESTTTTLKVNIP